LNPFVFLVGCPRSGTTLLQRLVDAHPALAIPPETHWIPKFFLARTGLAADGSVTPALLEELLAHRTFGKLEIGPAELEEMGRDRPQYAVLVSRLFTRYAAARGKPLAGDKTPGYARQLPLLHALWPHARFVHLLRDGRDVCLSATNWQSKLHKLRARFPTWTDDAVGTAALWWEWHVRTASAAGRVLGPGIYYKMWYEALVARPEQECRRLCSFLDLPYDVSMLRFHEGRTVSEPGLDAKHSWQPITPGLRDWRTQMAADDVERFEAVGGDLLEELGYPRGVPQPSPQILAYAAELRERFPRPLVGAARGSVE
jgi:hypothetical protein